MEIVTQVTELLQGLLSESMDALARETGCVKRERKFSGSTLLSSLVLTVLRKPTPKSRDYQTTAAQLGVIVTEDAIAQRFTPDLVNFLEPALQRMLGHVLTADAPPIALLERFAEVVIGDSTTIALPDEYAERFPGCGGSHGGGKAALKIQVLWELRHGTLHVLLEPGRASDAKSPISAIPSAPEPCRSSTWDIFPWNVSSVRRRRRAIGFRDCSMGRRSATSAGNAGICGHFSKKTRTTGWSMWRRKSVTSGWGAAWWPCVCRRKWSRGDAGKSAKRRRTTAASRRRNTCTSKPGRSSSATVRRSC